MMSFSPSSTGGEVPLEPLDWYPPPPIASSFRKPERENSDAHLSRPERPRTRESPKLWPRAKGTPLSFGVSVSPKLWPRAKGKPLSFGVSVSPKLWPVSAGEGQK